MITIRPATHADTDAIDALLAPEIARGTVLSRTIVPEDFLVATTGPHLVGTVALTPQSTRVVELGSLVSTMGGVRLGQRLVAAVMATAATRGFEVVMALTAIPAYFEQVGFRVASHTPWISARRQLSMPHPLPLAPSDDAIEAANAKATACRTCPRLATCTQALLLRTIPVRHRKQA